MTDPSKKLTLEELKLEFSSFNKSEPFYLDDNPIDFSKEPNNNVNLTNTNNFGDIKNNNYDSSIEKQMSKILILELKII